MQTSGKVDSLIIPPPPPAKPPVSRASLLTGLLALAALIVAGIALVIGLSSRPTEADATSTPSPEVEITEATLAPTFDTGVLTQAAADLQVTLAAAVSTGVQQQFDTFATQTAAVPTNTPTSTVTATQATAAPSATLAPSATNTPVNELVISPLAGADKPFVYIGSIRGLTLVVYTLNQSRAETLTLSASYGGFIVQPPGVIPDVACSLPPKSPLEVHFDPQPVQVIYCAPNGLNLVNPVEITARDDAGHFGRLSLELRRDVVTLSARQIATALEPIACPYEPAANATTPPLNIIPFVFHLTAQDEIALPRAYRVVIAPTGSFVIYNPEDNCSVVKNDAIFAKVDRDLVGYYVFPPDGDRTLPEIAVAGSTDAPGLTGTTTLKLQPMMVSLLDEQILVLSEPDTTSAPLVLPRMDGTTRLGKGQSLIITAQQNEWLVVATNRGPGYVRNFGSLVGVVGNLP